jgi:hypothetical protein
VGYKILGVYTEMGSERAPSSTLPETPYSFMHLSWRPLWSPLERLPYMYGHAV